MNKTLAGLIVGLVLGAGGAWLLLHKPAAQTSAPPTATAPAAGAAKVEEKPNPLRLPAAKRTQAGITLAKPTAQTLVPEVQGYGRVLDASSLATVVAEMTSTAAALQAAEKELERAKKLFAAGGNASAQAVETAQAAVERERAASTSAQARLAAMWGRNVARNVGTISAALGEGAALARIDLLPGDAPASEPKQATIRVPGQSAVATAEILGPAPVADPQALGVSFLALIRQPALAAGAAFRATLPGSGEAASALVVPRSAIVYHQGSAWLYVLGEEDTFERKLVTVGRSVGAEAVAILSGLEPDEQVATNGAQQLLAAELQAGETAEP